VEEVPVEELVDEAIEERITDLGSQAESSHQASSIGGVNGGNDESDESNEAEASNYAKLVTTFLRTEFDSTRRRVARRLHEARNSEVPQTRKLAEAAIDRIRDAGQYGAFENALEDSPFASTSI
jgi:hypothetical protein